MIDILVRKKTDNFIIQMVRYTFSGGVAFLVDFAIMVLLTEFADLNYLLSALIGFTAGLTVVYTLSTQWVFNKRRIASKKAEFFIFSLIGVVGLGLNELFMWLFTEYAGLYYMISKILATGMVYAWNFLSRKYLLFHDSPSD